MRVNIKVKNGEITIFIRLMSPLVAEMMIACAIKKQIDKVKQLIFFEKNMTPRNKVLNAKLIGDKENVPNKKSKRKNTKKTYSFLK